MGFELQLHLYLLIVLIAIIVITAPILLLGKMVRVLTILVDLAICLGIGLLLYWYQSGWKGNLKNSNEKKKNLPTGGEGVEGV